MYRLSFILVLAVGAVTSLACGDSAAPERSDSLTTNPTPTVETLSVDEAAALQVARDFIEALERRDAPALTGLLSASWLSGSGPEWAGGYGGTSSVRGQSFAIDRSRPKPSSSVLVVVQLDVVPVSSNTQWNQGANARVMQLVNEDGAWKVAGIGG